MAYINLKYIGELAREASLLNVMAESSGYNTDAKKDRLPDGDFVAMIKVYRQAKNLFDKLSRLHKTCTDFVAGNLQPYIDDYEKWADDDTPPFDIWEELERCFNTDSVDDLPERIEQYAELLALSRSFVKMQKAKQEGFNKFFGGSIPRYYQAVDGAEQTVMIPESEMPEAFLNQRAAEAEIANIEVEYALDRYNEFYQIASGIYGSYAGASDDVVPCAEAILSLFAH